MQIQNQDMFTLTDESCRTKRLWYEIQLQTSPTKYRRVVGFDKKSRKQIFHHQNTGNPVKIINVTEQEDSNHLIGDSSSIIQVNPADVRIQKQAI